MKLHVDSLEERLKRLNQENKELKNERDIMESSK